MTQVSEPTVTLSEPVASIENKQPVSAPAVSAQSERGAVETPTAVTQEPVSVPSATEASVKRETKQAQSDQELSVPVRADEAEIPAARAQQEKAPQEQAKDSEQVVQPLEKTEKKKLASASKSDQAQNETHAEKSLPESDETGAVDSKTKETTENPLLPQICKSLWAKLAVVLVVVVLCCTLPYWWYFKRSVDLPEGVSYVDVTVPAGASGRAIANRIAQAGIGVSPDTLIGLLRVQGTALSIHAGRYRFTPGMTLADIVDKLQRSDVEKFSFRIADGIGYIKVNRFGRTTMGEFREAFERLGRPAKLVLDLRGNGGGLLEQAIGMAEFFLPRGALIVSTEGRSVPPRSYCAQRDGEALGGKLVVLIDEVSASASEIVTGAIQDWDRGVVVGRPSFGKGLVQRQVMLGDGSAVRITIARYHTPSGRIIQRPYEKGKRREYYLDHLRRYDDAVRDSLDAAAPEFRTLRTGRTVRGGGGIRPDVPVDEDTTGYSKYYAELIRRGVVNEYVVATMDRRRDSLERRYPDFGAFDAGFVADTAMLREVAELGAARGVAVDSAGLGASASLMRIQLKALVAQRLYGTEAFYRVINAERSETFHRAVAILEEWEKRGLPLLEKGK